MKDMNKKFKGKKKAPKACVYCGSIDNLTVDHVVPLSKWKEFHIRRRVLDNNSNKVVACIRCNSEKSSLSPREWFELHPGYKKRFLCEARYLSNDVKRITGISTYYA